MAEYDREEEAAKLWVQQLRRDKWASTPEQREEWELIMEWQAIPTTPVRFRDEISGYDRVRIERPCPPDWWNDEDGTDKLRRLCWILDRDPFTSYPTEEE